MLLVVILGPQRIGRLTRSFSRAGVLRVGARQPNPKPTRQRRGGQRSARAEIPPPWGAAGDARVPSEKRRSVAHTTECRDECNDLVTSDVTACSGASSGEDDGQYSLG
jgi:hypothetical protein